MFIVLLRFSSSLVAKLRSEQNVWSLNGEPCMLRPTLIDSNLVQYKYYPSMLSLDKCNGSCNNLSPKICVPKKNKT